MKIYKNIYLLYIHYRNKYIFDNDKNNLKFILIILKFFDIMFILIILNNNYFLLIKQFIKFFLFFSECFSLILITHFLIYFMLINNTGHYFNFLLNILA